MFGPRQMLVNVDSQGFSVAYSINLLAFYMYVDWTVGGIWQVRHLLNILVRLSYWRQR